MLQLPGQSVVVAKGGRGGRGNLAFVSGDNRSPVEAEAAAPGEIFRLHLELKIIADVGLVGYRASPEASADRHRSHRAPAPENAVQHNITVLYIILCPFAFIECMKSSADKE